jgi:hypothetical protein
MKRMNGFFMGISILLSAVGASAQDTTRWDVEAALGPARTLSFETDEVTWASVTVDPAGRTILFDVLGDIYAMPIAGTGAGVATRIAAGAAYHMQPRFSPDGRWVAYISDAGGGHNVWLMRPDGSEQRQVTQETQRLVNSPALSPDGSTIYVRKHFIEQRRVA